MRERVWRSLLRLVVPALLLVCLAVPLSSRTTVHAAPVVSLSIVNARVGLLHFSGSGYPANVQLSLSLFGATLANPTFITQYTTAITTPQGSFDQDFYLGEFVCGTELRLVVNGGSGVLAEAGPVLGQCPNTSPTIAITSNVNHQLTISGQGFAIVETVSISVTSLINTIGGAAATVSDQNGAFQIAVSLLGAFNCGDTLTVMAIGQAGSLATAGPVLYNCDIAPTPVPTPFPTAIPNDPLPQPAAHSHASAVQHPYLSITSGPSAVAYHQVETLRMATGVPFAHLTARLSTLGMPLATFNLHADAQGNAQQPYRVPIRLRHGQTIEVHYTVSYALGARLLQEAGSFTIIGA